MFEQTISIYIEGNSLLEKDKLHLVALSGGADSVALFMVLLRLGYNIQAAHCNFNLRGEESIRDEEFCKDLCRRNGVKLHLAHFDTRFYSLHHHISIEMAARELRYNFFRQLMEEFGMASICVAHHRDDNAETVLLNLFRGTGMKGLTGIHPRNESVVRPLLCVGRKDIEEYLRQNGQEYIVDSSNLVNDVKRNKIRLDIMPVANQLNPSVSSAIVQTAQHVADAMPFLEESLNRWENECVRPISSSCYAELSDEMAHFQSVSIDIYKLKSSPSPEYLLYHILTKRGIPAQMTHQIYEHLDSKSGTSWNINGLMMTVDRGCLLIEPIYSSIRELKIPMEGRYVLSNGDRIEVSVCQKDKDFHLDTASNVAQLDADSVRWPFTLRCVEKGDRFVPFGMNGSKLVSDLLTDRKMSLQQKRNQLCVTDESGQIVWLVGLRIGNKYRITSDTIKYVYFRYYKK